MKQFSVYEQTYTKIALYDMQTASYQFISQICLLYMTFHIWTTLKNIQTRPLKYRFVFSAQTIKKCFREQNSLHQIGISKINVFLVKHQPEIFGLPIFNKNWREKSDRYFNSFFTFLIIYTSISEFMKSRYRQSKGIVINR